MFHKDEVLLYVFFALPTRYKKIFNSEASELCTPLLAIVVKTCVHNIQIFGFYNTDGDISIKTFQHPPESDPTPPPPLTRPLKFYLRWR